MYQWESRIGHFSHISSRAQEFLPDDYKVEGLRLGSKVCLFYIPDKLFQPGQERYQFTKENPGTKCPSGPISEVVKIIVRTACYMLPGPVLTHYRNMLPTCIAQIPLVLPPPGNIEAASEFLLTRNFQVCLTLSHDLKPSLIAPKPPGSHPC